MKTVLERSPIIPAVSFKRSTKQSPRPLRNLSLISDPGLNAEATRFDALVRAEPPHRDTRVPPPF